MQDVADDRHTQPINASEAFANREQVEQGLSRMRVPAVAGVDDRRRDFVGHDVGCAGLMMAHDHEVGAERLQRADGVDQRLALGD